jgi:hypothetical protein
MEYSICGPTEVLSEALRYHFVPLRTGPSINSGGYSYLSGKGHLALVSSIRYSVYSNSANLASPHHLYRVDTEGSEVGIEVLRIGGAGDN